MFFLKIIVLIMAFVLANLAGRKLEQGKKGEALTKALIAIICAIVATH